MSANAWKLSPFFLQLDDLSQICRFTVDEKIASKEQQLEARSLLKIHSAVEAGIFACGGGFCRERRVTCSGTGLWLSPGRLDRAGPYALADEDAQAHGRAARRNLGNKVGGRG
jgi:hypothetical protein